MHADARYNYCCLPRLDDSSNPLRLAQPLKVLCIPGPQSVQLLCILPECPTTGVLEQSLCPGLKLSGGGVYIVVQGVKPP